MSKLGEDFLAKWAQLGLQELRNAAGFEQSNVADDIRRSVTNPQQDLQYPVTPTPATQTSPTPELEQQQER